MITADTASQWNRQQEFDLVSSARYTNHRDHSDAAYAELCSDRRGSEESAL